MQGRPRKKTKIRLIPIISFINTEKRHERNRFSLSPEKKCFATNANKPAMEPAAPVLESAAKMKPLLFYRMCFSTSTQGVAQYAAELRKAGKKDHRLDRFVLEGLFTTVTNVNFDADKVDEKINQGLQLREEAKAALGQSLPGPASF